MQLLKLYAALYVWQPRRCFIALAHNSFHVIKRFKSIGLGKLVADPDEWLNLEDKENDQSDLFVQEQWEYEIRVFFVTFFTICGADPRL